MTRSATATPALRSGWEPGCPVDDTITQGAVSNLAEHVSHLASAMGGRTHRDDKWALGDQGLPAPFVNLAVARQPVTSAADVFMLTEFFSGPFMIMSAWPTPDLSGDGYTLVGHP